LIVPPLAAQVGKKREKKKGEKKEEAGFKGLFPTKEALALPVVPFQKKKEGETKRGEYGRK